MTCNVHSCIGMDGKLDAERTVPDICDSFVKYDGCS